MNTKNNKIKPMGRWDITGNNLFMNTKSRIFVSLALLIMLFLGSCTVTSYDVTSVKQNTCTYPLKCDVIGFSEQIYPSYKDNEVETPFCLKGADIFALIDYIKGLKQGQETALYYAFDNGLDRILYTKETGILSDKTKCFMITFTDGLDNTSNILGNVKGKSAAIWQAKYQKNLNGKMDRTWDAVNGNFQSYVTVFFSEDLRKSDWKAEDITEIMSPFTGTAKTGTTDVIIKDNIEELAGEFSKKFTDQNFKFSVPKGNVGERIRMKLTTVEGDTIFIEGDLSGSKEEYYLKNISTTNGISFKVSKEKKGLVSMRSAIDEVKVVFELKYLKKANGETLSLKQGETEEENKKLQRQFILQKGGWRLNSEYVPVPTSVKDAYIMLVMDCSKSMGDYEFITAKVAMLQMIGVIVDEEVKDPIFKQTIKLMDDYEKSNLGKKDLENLETKTKWTKLKMDVQKTVEKLEQKRKNIK
jgi:hypothetical protein